MGLADPILDAHLVAHQCFEIGGSFSPASVRDQMLRASLIVRRALWHGLIDQNAKSLVIVGAGPTGLTAAMAAVDRGVATTLIDKNNLLFGRYLTCSTRDIDPTLYDWPTEHWLSGQFPFEGQPMPLTWSAGSASTISIGWERDFLAWQAGLSAAQASRFAFLANTRYVAPPTGLPAPPNAAGLIDVSFKTASTTSTRPFGALLSCVGWGEERVRAQGTDAYRGYYFWEHDKLQGGLPNANILISGGGDGALQDLIRIVTGQSAKAFLDSVFGSEPFKSSLDRSSAIVRDAEDIAARALSWSGSDQEDAVILERLEAKHEDAIDALIAETKGSLLKHVAACAQGGQFGQVDLAHRGQCFSQCYALNRFLSLLILRAIGGVVRLKGTEVIGIGPADGHVCSHPDSCQGRPHDAKMKGPGAKTGPYEVVVVRHGLVGPKKLFSNFDPSRVRQLLPYFSS